MCAQHLMSLQKYTSHQVLNMSLHWATSSAQVHSRISYNKNITVRAIKSRIRASVAYIPLLDFWFHVI